MNNTPDILKKILARKLQEIEDRTGDLRSSFDREVGLILEDPVARRGKRPERRKPASLIVQSRHMIALDYELFVQITFVARR